MRKKGNEFIYLGPNTPFDGLLELIETKKLSIIAISMTNTAPLVRVEKWIQACLETNTKLKFAIGGKGVLRSQRTVTPSVLYLTDSNWESLYESQFH
ncbi:hypothetical protein P9D43_27025 [Neobacillus niacini]|uniref:hypothetical protein n=1 Tax=Neobacillus niacini TaxID=86668 RepID=UPI0012FB5D7A|nr:hypothetical protein [Neobacillus niacini]MEC1525660.1 hypothetical protein [Neobacillus niacini]